MKRRRPLIVPRWKYEHDVSVLTDRCKLQSGEIERMARKLGRAVEERDGYEAQVAELLMESDRLRRKVAALEAQSMTERPYWSCPTLADCTRLCNDADHWRDHLRAQAEADASTPAEATFGGEP